MNSCPRVLPGTLGVKFLSANCTSEAMKLETTLMPMGTHAILLKKPRKYSDHYIGCRLGNVASLFEAANWWKIFGVFPWGQPGLYPPKNPGSQPEIGLPCPPSWSEKVQPGERVLLVPTLPPHGREAITEGNLKQHAFKQSYFNLAYLKHEGTWNWKIQKERRNHKTIFWNIFF